jgi:hypothetical protein
LQGVQDSDHHTPDGEGLRCARADGSVTWQRQARQAAFFAPHDLPHFAVQSTFGHRRGFYGLIGQGEDTTAKGLAAD